MSEEERLEEEAGEDVAEEVSVGGFWREVREAAGEWTFGSMQTCHKVARRSRRRNNGRDVGRWCQCSSNTATEKAKWDGWAGSCLLSSM